MRNCSAAVEMAQHENKTASVTELIRLEQVSSVLPNRPHRSTVFRWAKKGRFGIRLRVVSMGGTRCTTERWLMEFFEAVEHAQREHDAPRTQTPRRRGLKRKGTPDQRALVEAQAVLRRFGVLGDE